jgi:hypothetical protein
MKYILAGLVLRLIVAFWNGFFGPSFGADGDAVEFHLLAVEFSRFGVFDAKFNIGWVYSIFLGSIYFLTVNSLFLGSVLSCIAWLISALILDKSIKLMGFQQKYRDWALMIYAFLPSSILFTSVTLREVYQLLFVNLLIFSALMIIVKLNKKYWFVLLFSIIFLALLHFGLVLYGILGAIATFYFSSTRGSRALSIELFIFYLPIGALLTYGGISLFLEIVPYSFSDGIAAAVQSYQSGHNVSRAMYVYKPEINGIFDLMLFLPVSFGQYMLEPMPWKVETPLDLALFIENVGRCVLVFFAISRFFMSKSSVKIPFFFLIAMYFALEFLWAVGTVNWGSAVRHHIPSIGLLVIVGVCFLDKRMMSKPLKFKKRKLRKI